MTRRHFEDRGADYAQSRPTYPAELAAALADCVPGHNLALDVGCGSGQLSILLAEHFDRVLATDVSEDQLAHAASHPKVSYSAGAAERLDVTADGTVDLITAAQAAHWFDLEPFYEEVRRAGRPGGAVALVTYGVMEIAGPAKDRIDRFYWQDIHSYWPPDRVKVETGYRDLPFPFKRIAIPPLAIHRDWSVQQFINYVTTWSAMKGAEKAGQGGLKDELEGDLRGIVGDETIGVTWPITVIAGRI